MDITPRKRASIAALRTHTKLTVRQISDKLGVPKSTVGRIVNRLNNTGDVGVLRRSKCGRKRKSTAYDDKVLLRNSVTNSRKTS